MHPVFAYGSNLDSAQMTGRCPGAVEVGHARAYGWRVAFGARPHTPTGAATLVVAPAEAWVDGVVWVVDDTDLTRLDAYEGVPHVYARCALRVTIPAGVDVMMWVYVMSAWQGPARPVPVYVDKIVRAYRTRAFSPRPLARALLEAR